MSESNPLAGLTGDQADDRIEQFAERVKHLQESAKAAADHLKEMKAARKTLTEPEATAEGNGTRVNAEPAEISVEGGEV